MIALASSRILELGPRLWKVGTTTHPESLHPLQIDADRVWGRQWAPFSGSKENEIPVQNPAHIY